MATKPTNSKKSLEHQSKKNSFRKTRGGEAKEMRWDGRKRFTRELVLSLGPGQSRVGY